MRWPVDTVRRKTERGEVREYTMPPAPAPFSQLELEQLRVRVADMLRNGFPPEPGYRAAAGARLEATTGLQFGVRRAHRSRPEKLNLASAATRRAYTAPGAYTLLVDGLVGDLVPYLVMHLLTRTRHGALGPVPGAHGEERQKRALGS